MEIYNIIRIFDYNLINALLLGWLSSGTSYALNVIFGDDGIKIEHKGVEHA